MYRKLITLLVFAVAATFCLTIFAQTGSAKKMDQQSIADSVKKAAEKNARKQTYQLAYNLLKGEEIHSTVEHVAETKTQIAGHTVESTSRSETTRKWRVINVDSLGNMTFVGSIVAVDMWSRFDDEEPEVYNSRKPAEEIPQQYRVTADTVGKTQFVLTIAPNGEILDRKSNLPSGDFSVGDITIPLPKQPIAKGYVWNVPTVLNANEGEKEVKVKAQVRYELEKVKGNTAYISFKTQIISQMSEKVKSTVMQKMTRGHIAFNMKYGRPTLKVVEWNEKVQGFEGSDSYLRLVGRATEKVTPPKLTPTGSRLAPVRSNVAAKPSEIKPREGGPILRK
ncbi:MAG: hypothetical protein AB8B55_05865 [Mariniblastus sp.]